MESTNKHWKTIRLDDDAYRMLLEMKNAKDFTKSNLGRAASFSIRQEYHRWKRE
tara:strand:+ start:806 stop:967 length:162 start_codon:yes stop_codon:yes gene_type:complete